VFGALVRVMLHRGPTELTLREIAAEAGLTAGALVQRFGSKRALLLAHARHAAATGDVGFSAPVGARATSPLQALRAATAVHARLAESPRAALRNLQRVVTELSPTYAAVALAIRKPPFPELPGTVPAVRQSYRLQCAADGMLYQLAICHAARQLGLEVQLCRRGDETARAAHSLSVTPGEVEEFVTGSGRPAGPPWTQELGGPVFADNGSVSQKHIAEFFALLGRGVKEPGWQNTQLSRAWLAIVPGYSHYNFVSATELAPIIIDKYLADPQTNPSAGAAAASQAE
jgi:AcrR family transcriptional regulator